MLSSIPELRKTANYTLLILRARARGRAKYQIFSGKKSHFSAKTFQFDAKKVQKSGKQRAQTNKIANKFQNLNRKLQIIVTFALL